MIRDENSDSGFKNVEDWIVYHYVEINLWNIPGTGMNVEDSFFDEIDDNQIVRNG